MIETKDEGSEISISGTGGDVVGVDVSGTGNVIGKNISIQQVSRELQNVPDEYFEALKDFAVQLNLEFQKYNVPQDKANGIQRSIVALGKEVEGISLDKTKNLSPTKQASIESQATDLIDKVLDAVPPAAETALMFTPLYPFGDLIRKGVKQIVDAVKEYRNKNKK